MTHCPKCHDTGWIQEPPKPSGAVAAPKPCDHTASAYPSGSLWLAKLLSWSMRQPDPRP